MYGAKLFLSLILKISAMNLTYWMQLGDIGGTDPSAATTLSAAQNINLATTTSESSSNQSKSDSVGVAIQLGAGSAGLSLDIAASKGKGQANGDSTSYTNSQIEAGQQVDITSGADTKLQGGNIQARQVTANVGGKLNIQSLQDTTTSAASQKTTGVALNIPITGAGGCASISQSKQRSNLEDQSVRIFTQIGCAGHCGNHAMNHNQNSKKFVLLTGVNKHLR